MKTTRLTAGLEQIRMPSVRNPWNRNLEVLVLAQNVGASMSDTIAVELAAEIKATRHRVAEQRRLIKRSKGNAVILEAAKADIREMRTHLTVLESNLRKSALAAEAEVPITGA